MALEMGRIGTAVVLVVLSIGGGIAAAGSNAKARLKEICRTTTDGPRPEVDVLFREVWSLGDDGRKALLKLAGSRDEIEAICGLDYLIKFDDARVLPLVRKILDDPRASAKRKLWALYGVRHFKDKLSFERAMEAFRSGNSELVSAAASALGAIGDERGLRVLREAMVNPRYSPWSLAGALGVKGHEQAIGPLLELLKDPKVVEYESLRGDVVRSLARIGGPRGREATLTALEGFRDEVFRGRAATDVWGVWREHRKEAVDPAEVAAIEEAIAKVRVWAEKRS